MQAWQQIILSFALGTALVCMGCASKPEPEGPANKVEVTYSQAISALHAKQYKTAAEGFDRLQRDHPYSAWATQAQIMEAYALYMQGKYEEAIEACQEFQSLHPRHEHADYMLYLNGIAHYEQITDVSRDQEQTAKTEQAFLELIAKYPDTAYARDARFKMDLINDHLAGKEMTIGRFYHQQHNWIAAIGRFQYVIEHYQTTIHTPEALFRLVECFYALGVRDEAKKYAAVLGHNYPNSKWYHRAYALLH
jgi:outer membrane protein assembly factor BamD